MALRGGEALLWVKEGVTKIYGTTEKGKTVEREGKITQQTQEKLSGCWEECHPPFS